MRITSLPNRGQGFALVVTVTLMALLTITALGLLSLSSIALRSSSVDNDTRVAQANARLALMMAIDRLQQSLGPDQRISAPADQLASENSLEESTTPQKHRQWTGVYNAWPAPATNSVDDFYPSPVFREWLVSGKPEDTKALTFAGTNLSSGSVELVGTGSAGSNGNPVEAPLVQIKTGRHSGHYAWWVGDLGAKALISRHQPEPTDAAGVRSRMQALPGYQFPLAQNGQPGSERPFGGILPTTEKVSVLPSWQSTALVNPAGGDVAGLFHDLTTFNRGLLTNVRRGGLRKDLSMYLERSDPKSFYSDFDNENVGAFSLKPENVLYTVASDNPHQEYTNKGINMAELWAYYNSYKELRRGSKPYSTGGSIPAGTSYLRPSGDLDTMRNDPFYFLKQPTIISYKTLISFTSRPSPASPDRRLLAVAHDPIVVFWNPLDVPIDMSHIYNSVKWYALPYNLEVNIGNKNYNNIRLGQEAFGGVAFLSTSFGKAEHMIMKPGEVMMLSQGAGTPTNIGGGTTQLDARLGWNFGGGADRILRAREGGNVEKENVEFTQDDILTFGLTPNEDRIGLSRNPSVTHHDWLYGDDRSTINDYSQGIGGVFIDYRYGLPFVSNAPKANRRVAPLSTIMKPNNHRYTAPQYPDLFRSFPLGSNRSIPGAQLFTSSGAIKEPFLLFSFNVKTEDSTGRGGQNFTRFNPKMFMVDFFAPADAELDILPFEIEIVNVDSPRSQNLEMSPSGQAYYGAGMTAGSGVNFVTTHSIPREPIHSLAALQHSFANGLVSTYPQQGYDIFNCRFPMLPHNSHAIGNSLAPSVLSKNKVRGELPGRMPGGARPLADHSYLANAALWDDWFFSGIAPQTVVSFSLKRNQKKVAQDFLEGTKSLPVTAFLPSLGSQTPGDVLDRLFAGPGQAPPPTEEATDIVASLIEVDGLFNVNSTSVEAWRTLLGALRKSPVVTRNVAGDQSITPASAEETPVTSLLGPENSVLNGTSNVGYQQGGQWTGRRTLTDPQIDLLARAIVMEVRKRGPFLSLSDFINRRPQGATEQAKSGAVQSAIDSDLAKLNQGFETRSVAASISNRFPFSEAEQSFASYGIPGYLKQADILTPIAPILSARSDSFVIRAYGTATDASGNVLARAWCEAVVQRTAEFIDPSDNPLTNVADLNPTNQAFGRRFKTVSFRWLSPDEV